MTPKPDNVFKIGDHVELISGGPGTGMTIIDVPGTTDGRPESLLDLSETDVHTYTCEWFAGMEHKSGHFIPESLKPALGKKKAGE